MYFHESKYSSSLRICSDDPCGKCMLVLPATVIVKDNIETNACIVEHKYFVSNGKQIIVALYKQPNE